jgi:ATP-dependent DNA ligase
MSREMHRHNPGPVRRPPGFIEPCLPTLASTVPIGPQWAYEIKHDGFRFICRREGDSARVFSRRGYDWTGRVPAIVLSEDRCVDFQPRPASRSWDKSSWRGR